MLEHFTYATFSGREGEPFRIELTGDSEVTAELIQAVNQPALSEDGGEHFSLVFQIPETLMLPQAMYTFRHDELGTFPLFIVPIGRSAEGIQYEAVFNRAPRHAEDAP